MYFLIQKTEVWKFQLFANDYVASKFKGQDIPVGWSSSPSQGEQNFMGAGAQIKHTEESEVRTAIWDVATKPTLSLREDFIR